MEMIIQSVEMILYACIVILPVTTLILIRIVKKENQKMIEGAVTNPIFPNLDFRFFSELQREYIRITGKTLLAKTNKLSLYFGLGAFFLLFILIIIGEISTL